MREIEMDHNMRMYCTPGKSCKNCQVEFDACDHFTTFINDDGIKECAFCDKKLSITKMNVKRWR